MREDIQVTNQIDKLTDLSHLRNAVAIVVGGSSGGAIALGSRGRLGAGAVRLLLLDAITAGLTIRSNLTITQFNA